MRVSLVLPGQSRETPFGQNARARMQEQGVVVPEPYSDLPRRVFERITGQPSRPLTRPLDVAEVISRAVHEPSSAIRQPAGADAVELAKSH